jgi:hypothetical protein
LNCYLRVADGRYNSSIAELYIQLLAHKINGKKEAKLDFPELFSVFEKASKVRNLLGEGKGYAGLWTDGQEWTGLAGWIGWAGWEGLAGWIRWAGWAGQEGKVAGWVGWAGWRG